MLILTSYDFLDVRKIVYWDVGCKIVAFYNFVDRPGRYDSITAKSCKFLAQEKTCMVWCIYFFIHMHNLTQSNVSKTS
jgi:hypothetical protein